MARSWPGRAKVSPTSPCSPGGRPVPSEARLAVVVAGNEAVIERESSPEATEARKGASTGWASNCFHPRPSTRKRQARSTGSMASSLANPGAPSADSREGITSAGDARPYRGTGGPSAVIPGGSRLIAVKHPFHRQPGLPGDPSIVPQEHLPSRTLVSESPCQGGLAFGGGRERLHRQSSLDLQFVLDLRQERVRLPQGERHAVLHHPGRGQRLQGLQSVRSPHFGMFESVPHQRELHGELDVREAPVPELEVEPPGVPRPHALFLHPNAHPPDSHDLLDAEGLRVGEVRRIGEEPPAEI